MKILKKAVFLIVILIGFLIRTPYLNRPIIDYHSWKQTETYAIAKKFSINNLNILKPVSNLKCDVKGECYTFNSFPLYEYILGINFKIFGENIVVVRVFSITITLLTSIIIFLITKEFFGFLTGLISLLIFNLLPFSVFWGRTVLPEILAVFLSTLSIYLIIKRKKYIALSAIVLGLSILIKPYFTSLLIPIIYYLWKKNKRIELSLYVLINLLLFILWNAYTYFLPQVKLAVSALSFNKYGISLFFNNQNPFLYSKSINWPLLLVQKIIEILTPIGFILLIIGIIKNRYKKILFYWFLASILSFIIVINGNFEHEYYQFIIIPIASIFIAISISSFIKKFKKPNIYIIFLVLFTFFYWGWIPFSNYLISHYRPEVRYSNFYKDTKNIQSIIPKKESIIIIGDESPTLLNHIDREGWIITQDFSCSYSQAVNLIHKYKELGASYLIIQLLPYNYYLETKHHSCLINNIEINSKIIYKGEYLILYKLI